MAMQCANCGVEILQGQRFCRACGAPVEGSVAPTQVMDTDPEGLIKVNNTKRTSKTNTNPVANATNGGTTFIQLPQNPQTELIDAGLAPQQAINAPVEANPSKTRAIEEATQAAQVSIHSTSPFQPEPPVYTPANAASDFQTTPPASLSTVQPPKKSYGWLVAFGAIALVGVIFFAFLLMGRARRAANPPPTSPSASSAPDRPTDLYMDETTARVTDDETVFTQKFPLPNSAKFSLNNISGDITIEGIDSSEAEVKIIKRGGSADQRKDIKIIYSTLGGNLSLKPSQQFSHDIDIIYEIKLPRNLGQVNVIGTNSDIKLKDIDALLEIKSVSGALDLSNLRGQIKAETQSGELFLSQVMGDIFAKTTSGKIELSGVSGSIKTDNTAGDTKATIDSTTSADMLSFESINGKIDLRFKSAINAELEANTISGSIDLEGVQIEVRKMPGSSQAIGRLGVGGQPLKIKTVSGNIKITQRS
jgi:DUF4097 and DUF4098 domain-containing protein YvlB